MRRFIRLIVALSITIGVSGITGRNVRATEYQVNRMDNQRTSLVLSSGWQVIKTENFEVWPTSGWSVVDLSNDGYDRRWDSHTYKYHTGARAIWPARGGDGRIPVPGYDDYFNNMNTRMTYGLFDAFGDPYILPLEDQIVLKNIPDVHAIDLWAYSADDESSDAELTYQITSVTDTRCGISVIDGHWISINPQSGWLGFCDATVQVNDSLKTSSDTFRVTVVPVVGRIYLPIVGK